MVRYKTPLTKQELQAKTQNCQASSPIRRPPPPSSCLPEHQGLRQGTRAVRSWLAGATHKYMWGKYGKEATTDQGQVRKRACKEHVYTCLPGITSIREAVFERKGGEGKKKSKQASYATLSSPHLKPTPQNSKAPLYRQSSSIYQR